MLELEPYEIAKILHIISIVSWFAGLFYLPRIFVYHTQVAAGSDTDKIFQTMERKLLHYIMIPAMISSLIFGFYMASLIGFDFGWLHAKITFAFILVAYQHMLGRWRKDFANGTNKHSQKFYRLINEVPTLILIAVVTIVILKPF